MSVIPFPAKARPRVSEEVEKQLEGIEAKSAACYFDMEETSARLRDLAARIDASDEQSVPVVVDEEDSAVHHIEEVRTLTRT